MEPTITAGYAPRFAERRATQRIYEQFLAQVRGKDRDGRTFCLDAWLDNMGAGGLFLRLACSVQDGDQVSVVVRFSGAALGVDNAGSVSARGTVVRVEPGPNGTCGIAVKFTRHRFLYASE